MENHYNCIYMYTNLINGKKYVGKAKDFNYRHHRHLNDDKQLIDKKIKEYGIENFKIEILVENIDDSKIDDYEKFFIKRKRSHVSYGTGYNRTWGGEGGDTLSGMTEEQRKEYSKKLSKARKGRKIKPCSEEAKRKISEFFKGEKHPRARKVICLETKEIFGCIREASDWCHGNVKQNIYGDSKSAGKHPITGIKLHWMYYEDYLKLQEEEQQNNDNSDSTTNVA